MLIPHHNKKLLSGNKEKNAFVNVEIRLAQFKNKESIKSANVSKGLKILTKQQSPAIE